MSARDLNPTIDFYGELQNDSAFLGDLEAEDRRFDHERALPVAGSVSGWMREQLANPSPESLARAARLEATLAGYESKWALEPKFTKTAQGWK